jgi:tRNA G18 (ribose-2'-O)-methylase SpoU
MTRAMTRRSMCGITFTAAGFPVRMQQSWCPAPRSTFLAEYRAHGVPGREPLEHFTRSGGRHAPGPGPPRLTEPAALVRRACAHERANHRKVVVARRQICEFVAVPLHPPLDSPPEEVRAALAPHRNRFSVALYRCQNPFAVGAIIRVAHSFLARDIAIVGDAPYYPKASMGMHKYETIHAISDDAAFFAWAAGRPVWAVEKEAARRSVYAVERFPDDVILLFGSERGGLPASVLARADDVLAIPMYGVNNSFPVTVAAGIVMSEWARRRYAPGSWA